MPEPFDPYLHWLGIREPKRPPNHYRLLGVNLFESDAEVLANAANRQMAHVRNFQSGRHSLESQRLLNELAAAKLCLLNASRKEAYDVALRAQQTPPPAPAATVPPPSLAPVAAPPIVPPPGPAQPAPAAAPLLIDDVPLVVAPPVIAKPLPLGDLDELSGLGPAPPAGPFGDSIPGPPPPGTGPLAASGPLPLPDFSAPVAAPPTGPLDSLRSSPPTGGRPRSSSRRRRKQLAARLLLPVILAGLTLLAGLIVWYVRHR